MRPPAPPADGAGGRAPIPQDRRYRWRVWDNAAAETLRHAPRPIFMVGGYLTPLLAIIVVVAVFPGTPVVDALRTYAAGVVVTIVLAILYLGWNVISAPSRLDAAVRDQVGEERTAATAALDAMRAERDEARRALERHVAATAVTVDVRVVARDPLAAVDVSDAAIEGWLDDQKASFGSPPPPPAPRPEPPVGSGLSATAKMIQSLNLNAGAFGALRNAIEPRTVKQFRKEIDDWLLAARAGAREELLRQGLMAHIATLEIFAENTGRRYLSEVRVTLTFRIGALVQSAYASTRSSRLPDRPRIWDEQAYSVSAFLGIDQRYDHTIAVYEREDDIVVELGPSTVPPGNDEQVGSLVLAIPRPPAGTTIDGTWRVTAREAEDDAKGEFHLDVGPDTLGHEELRLATEAFLDRGGIA